MITNDVQYRTAKVQATRLESLLGELAERPLDLAGGELRRKVEIDTVDGQLSELRSQMSDYDALRSGQTPVGELASLDDLPRLLVRARIARGMSQRALAEELGLKEQQIQRYEASDYASASLSRLREVADLLGVPGEGLPEQGEKAPSLVRKLVDLGLDSEFVRRRLAPASLRERQDNEDRLAPVIDLSSRIGRVFGVEPSSLIAGSSIEPDRDVLAAASFKVPKTASSGRFTAYTIYAHYVALLALQATESLPQQMMPKTASEFRAKWEASDYPLSFDGLLRFVWDHGVPVVPLADPGAFHAAVWHSHGRDVIVLKQGARRASRWEFDLLHEIGHIAAGLGTSHSGVIDADEESTDPAEIQANQFAGAVLLGGKAEELVRVCVTEARNSVERLKRVVPKVAASHNVDTGALANYMAFRLSLQGINWWGAATNLQSKDMDPWSTCRDLLVERCDLTALNPIDRELLKQALVA
jgi:transcriptional regulator with XRE-family HTH domain/Zn-dependent peptidase ImmA (M78 family)